MLRSSEVKKVLIGGLGGFAVACFLSLCNIMVDKKLITELKVPSEYILQDKYLMTLLCNLQTYEIKECDMARLIKTCDSLIQLEHDSSAAKVTPGLALLNRAKDLMNTFPPACEETVKNVKKQLTKHYDNIVLAS